jgi:hypothetical protein
MSLLMNVRLCERLDVASTVDVDALLAGPWSMIKLFREIVRENGLQYDDLSSEIWIPEKASYVEYYSSPLLEVRYLDAVSALTSKAIKAKEKNKILVRNALLIFGDELSDRIGENGGNVSFFTVIDRAKKGEL